MKPSRIFKTWILACAALALLTACGGKPAVKYPSTPPDWVVKGGSAFKDAGKQVFYGVGAVTGIHNDPLAMSAADNRARAEIAKSFETYSAALMKDYASSVTGGAAIGAETPSSEQQSIEQSIKTFSSATLSGVFITDHWVNSKDGTVYALARLDLEHFRNNISKMKELNAELREFVSRNAEKSFNDLAQEEAKRGQ